MFRRRSLRLLLLFVAAYLLLCSAAGLFIAEATLHPARRPLLDADKTQAATMARRHDAQLTEAALSAFDGNTLRAWQLRPAHDNGDAVILLHGLSDNRMGMIGMRKCLSPVVARLCSPMLARTGPAAERRRPSAY